MWFFYLCFELLLLLYLNELLLFCKTATYAWRGLDYDNFGINCIQNSCVLKEMIGTQFDPEPRHRLRKRDKLTYIFY